MVDIYLLADASKPDLDLVAIHGERGYYVSGYYLLDFYIGDAWYPGGLRLDDSHVLSGKARQILSRWARNSAFPKG